MFAKTNSSINNSPVSRSAIPKGTFLGSLITASPNSSKTAQKINVDAIAGGLVCGCVFLMLASTLFANGRTLSFNSLPCLPFMELHARLKFSLLCFLFTIRIALGASVNRTIDDQFGDSVTGNLVSPISGWQPLTYYDGTE